MKNSIREVGKKYKRIYMDLRKKRERKVRYGTSCIAHKRGIYIYKAFLGSAVRRVPCARHGFYKSIKRGISGLSLSL